MPQTATNPQTGEKLQLDEQTNTWVPVSDKPAEWSELIGNIPASASKAGGEILQTLNPANWPEMLSTLGKTAGGGLLQSTRKMSEQFPESAGIAPYPKSDLEQYPDTLKKYVGDRYGSPQAAKQTAITDPIGGLLDVSGLLAGGAGIAGKQAGLLGKVATATDPIQAVKSAVRGTILSDKLPASLYKSAAKFPTTLDIKGGRGARTKLAETALKHRIMPTDKGAIKFEKIQNDLIEKIGGMVDDATTAGKKIPKAQVNKYLKDARRKVGGVRVDAKKNLSQINELSKGINEQMKTVKGKYLTPAQAQQLKISAQAKAKYSALPGQAPDTGTQQAAKSVARATKEGIEEAIPGIKEQNIELGKLKELSDPLARATARIENRDFVGIGTPLKMMAGEAAAGKAGTIMGAVGGVFEANKARIAMGMQALQDAGLGNLIDPSLKATLIQQGLLQSGRAGEELE